MARVAESAAVAGPSMTCNVGGEHVAGLHQIIRTA